MPLISNLKNRFPNFSFTWVFHSGVIHIEHSFSTNPNWQSGDSGWFVNSKPLSSLLMISYAKNPKSDVALSFSVHLESVKRFVPLLHFWGWVGSKRFDAVRRLFTLKSVPSRSLAGHRRVHRLAAVPGRLNLGTRTSAGRKKWWVIFLWDLKRKIASWNDFS